jgi:hypothetical protein
MINLLDGRFAVRHDAGIELFNEAGDYLRSVGQVTML